MTDKARKISISPDIQGTCDGCGQRGLVFEMMANAHYIHFCSNCLSRFLVKLGRVLDDQSV